MVSSLLKASFPAKIPPGSEISIRKFRLSIPYGESSKSIGNHTFDVSLLSFY